MALDIDYPLETNDFDYTQPVATRRPEIGSFYDTNTTANEADIFDMIHTFNKYDWMCVTGVLFVFYIVLRYAQKKVYGVKEPQALWVVTMFFIDQDYIDEVTLFLQVLSCVMSFFTFFTMQWLEGNMSTDLSTVEDPRAISSYEKLIEYQIKPLWLIGQPEVDRFKFATNGTAEAEVWQHAIKMGGNHFLEPTTGATIGTKIIYPFLDQKIAFISRNANVMTGGAFICKQTRDPESEYYRPMYCALIVKDPRGVEFLSTGVMGTNISDAIKMTFKRR